MSKSSKRSNKRNRLFKERALAFQRAERDHAKLGQANADQLREAKARTGRETPEGPPRAVRLIDGSHVVVTSRGASSASKSALTRKAAGTFSLGSGFHLGASANKVTRTWKGTLKLGGPKRPKAWGVKA